MDELIAPEFDNPIQETSRKNLKDNQFGIPEERKFPLDTKDHVKSAIKLFGHADEDKKKELAEKIADAAKKYNIEISKDIKVSEYLDESYITESPNTNNNPYRYDGDKTEESIRYAEYMNKHAGLAIVIPHFKSEVMKNQLIKYMDSDAQIRKESDILARKLFGDSNVEIYNKEIEYRNSDEYKKFIDYIYNGTVNESDDFIMELIGKDIEFKEFEYICDKAINFSQTSHLPIIDPRKKIQDVKQKYNEFLILPDESKNMVNDECIKLFGIDIHTLYKNCINRYNNTHSVSSSDIKENYFGYGLLPMLSPKEMIDLGVYSEDNNLYSSNPDNTKIGNITTLQWFKEYTLLYKGIKTETFTESQKVWLDTLRKLYFDYHKLTEESEINARKQSILELGWNPNIDITSINTMNASNKCIKKIEESCNINIIKNTDIESVEDYIEENSNSEYTYSNLDKEKDIDDFYKSMKIVFNSKNDIRNNNIHKSMKSIKYNDEIIGYIGFSYYNEDNKKYLGIGNFMIKPKYQSSGHGSKIIKDIINKNKSKYDEIYCYVDEKNIKAINFYKRIANVDTKNITKYGYYVSLYTKNKSIRETSYDYDTNIEESKTNNKSYPVSLIFVSGNSLLGKTIKKVLSIDYSHAAISLDSDLSRIYSFNNRNGFDGLAYESLKQYLKDGVDKIAVYTFFVSKDRYSALEKNLDYYSLFRNKTSYSVENLLSMPLNIPVQFNMKMVCSQFVDRLLKISDIDITNKKSSLVTPKDMYTSAVNNSNIFEIYTGSVKDMNIRAIERKIKSIQNKSTTVIFEDTNNAKSIIVEAKPFPIQFDKEGNLLIKNIKRIDYDAEYANSHRLLKKYEQSNSIEGMKYELCKINFLVKLLEKDIYKNKKNKAVEKKIISRAKLLNDFNKYLAIVCNKDKEFNFTEYFEASPYNDALIKIDSNTLHHGLKILKDIL